MSASGYMLSRPKHPDFILDLEKVRHVPEGDCLHGCFVDGVRMSAHFLEAQRIDVKVEKSDIWSVSAAVGLSLAAVLPRVNGILIHASGIELGGGGHIFVGPSGAGKSTIAENATGARIIHDDRIALRKKESTWKAFSVPLADNHGTVPGAYCASVMGIYILHKGKKLGLERRRKSVTFSQLIEQTICPFDRVTDHVACVESLFLLLEDNDVEHLIFRRKSDFARLI